MKKLHKNFLVMTAAAAVLAGCPADDEPGESDTDTSSTTAPTTSSTSMTSTTTEGTSSTTDPTDTSTTTMDPTSGTDSGDSTGEVIPPPPTLGDQLDRAGRPAVTAAAVDRFEGTTDPDHDDTVDVYNADDDFANWATAYTAAGAASLAIYDALDNDRGSQALFDPMNNCSTNVECYGTLGGLLVSDWLVVNTAGTTAAGYLGVELEVANAAAMNEAIGGRTLTDDVIDTSYDLLAGITIATPRTVQDGVDAPDSMPGDTFPYLADANN